MIDDILRQLNTWYNEPSQGGDRPKLLSKLATLELCGWLEGEFDRLALLIETVCLNDQKWVRENILAKSNGFHYADHWRVMLIRLVGEVFARRIEYRLDELFPGDLDQLKSLLGTLWKIRCDFAHADIGAIAATQQTFSAPSWVINQHRILTRLLDHYEKSVSDIVHDIKLP